jgi:hypothetical protein
MKPKYFLKVVMVVQAALDFVEKNLLNSGGPMVEMVGEGVILFLRRSQT